MGAILLGDGLQKRELLGGLTDSIIRGLDQVISDHRQSLPGVLLGGLH